MYLRHLNLEKNVSQLLLGPRGTGKSTLTKSQFSGDSVHYIDLLIPSEEDRFARDPDLLIRVVDAFQGRISHVVIDEIQKVPALLDVCHHLIESTPIHFILTGSSARKLKRGGANLLAGRALSQFLYPFTVFELETSFDLHKALNWGMLPKVWNIGSEKLKRKFLETYALTYLKEEIQAEQLVRAVDPFRKFLSIAAQMNGKLINFNSIAKDIGVDGKTVKNYFQILEDTMIGSFLEPYNSSVRKRFRKSPKFYFFDVGVQRALSRQTTINLVEETFAWGNAFEHFVITQIMQLSTYSGNQFEFCFAMSENDVEIDLICDRPGKVPLLVEIKSTKKITAAHVKSLLGLGRDISPDGELLLLSCDPLSQNMNGVSCLYWRDGLKKYFGGPDIADFEDL